MAQLSASDIAAVYRPEKCWRRVDCRRRGLAEAEPSPYTEVLELLGRRHEENYRRTLEPLLDLSQGSLDRRAVDTLAALRRKEPRLYQPVLRATAPFAADLTIVGIPDFLLLESSSYAVRDCKLSRRINARDHAEILEQVDLYGWLLQAATGSPPAKLEVVAGTGELVAVPFTRGESALSTLGRVHSIQSAGLADYEPVGWSKCQDCAYRAHCWDAAVAARDPAVLPGVYQRTALALRDLGITDYADLPGRFSAQTLSEVKEQAGARQQRVGSRAESILLHARAFLDRKVMVRAKPAVPPSDSYVMFDLEGLPPQLDAPEKIYLWGMQAFGARPGPCLQATADFGPEGDLHGWQGFLAQAKAVFDSHGDAPFVHWFHYEKDNVTKYIERYGDSDGIAARVLRNLCDLLPVTQAAVVLPDPSYSIKVVEKRAGYQRTMDEYGGTWSMAQYIKAVETEDEQLRGDTMNRILQYNREDLEATWAVLTWLRQQGG